jgi:hypothetical protein
VASSKVKGVFLADLTAKGLRCFCTCHEKAFLSSKLCVPDWEIFGTGQKYHASSTLNELRTEHGGEKHSPNQKILCGQEIATQVLETGGEGP